jgi:hypothetical protein
VRSSAEIFGSANRENNSVPLSLHRVGMDLIEVQYDPRDDGAGAVLSGAHALQPVRLDGDSLNVVVADGVWQVEQNPVGIGCRLNRRFNRSAERDFHA